MHRVHIDAAAMHSSQICNLVLSRTAYPSSYHSGLLSGLNECMKEGTREAVIWQIMCFLQPFSSLVTMRTSNLYGSGSTVKLAVKSVYHFAWQTGEIGPRTQKALQSDSSVFQHMWKSSLSRTVPSWSAHTCHAGRERGLWWHSRQETPLPQLSCPVRLGNTFRAFYSGYRTPALGAGAYFPDRYSSCLPGTRETRHKQCPPPHDRHDIWQPNQSPHGLFWNTTV